MQKADEARPAPFDGRTQPYASLSVNHYGERIRTWFAQLREQYVEYSLKPGDIGAILDAKTGEIQKVNNSGQYQQAGVQHGWHLRKLNGLAFTPQLQKQCEQGALDYVVTIEKHVRDVELKLYMDQSTV
jgi:predicted metalloprotease with PDZ domain